MTLQLSTEFIPSHDGTVHCVAAWNADIVITGGDDRMATIWKRAGASKDFGNVHTISDHEGAVRAITIIPVGHAGFVTGGFATASMDKFIRLYAFDPSTNSCELVRTCSGHTMGVLDLAWTADGELISGSWDGTARVWDVATGRCKHILQNHENGTCVAGLPNGDIVVGSTGRKEGDAHVDYKLRVWGLDSTNGPPAYVIKRTITDHEQAVRDITVLHSSPTAMQDGELAAPGGAAGAGAYYASVGNDGMLAIRRADGSVMLSFFNPTGPEGKPFSIFRVQALEDGRVATANEDQTVRVYSLDGSVEELGLPGTPWAVAGLPNGDVVVGCGQAGTSKRGHVYVYTTASDRLADDMTTANYATDMEPPKKTAAAGDGSGSSAGFKVTGPYDARAGFPGSQDGQYGFFQKDDGSVMVCTWSAVAGTWVDVGEVQGEDMGSEAGPTGNYDYTCAVTLDTNSGMRSMTLEFNEADDPLAVATLFCENNGIQLDNVEQVKNFVIERKMERSAKTRKTENIRQYTHFPSSAFADFYAIDFKKVLPKLLDNNANVAATQPALAMSAAEVELITNLVGTLEQTARYHASKVSRPAVKVLLGKLRGWPPAMLLPVVDIIRILVLHNDGAEATQENADAFLAGELARIRSLKDDADARAVLLVSARVLFNCFRHESTRTQVMDNASAVLDAAADLVQYPHASVKGAATTLMLNIATELVQRRKAAIAKELDVISATIGSSLDNSMPVRAVDADVVHQLIALVGEGLSSVTDADATYKLIVSLGTCASISADASQFAKDVGLEAKLAEAAARFPTEAPIREAAAEVRAFLSRK